MDEHRTCGQSELLQSGVNETWSPQFFHIIDSIVHAQKAMEGKNSEQTWVLAAFRRNGWLAWRPGSERLELASEQAWCKELPMGSSRIPIRWLENRVNWVTPERIPIEPDWSMCEIAKDMSDLVQKHCCNK